MLLFCRRESLLQIRDDIIDMLRADGKADGALGDALVKELFFGELGVGGGGRMNDQTLHVGNIGQQGEDLQAVDEAERRLFSAGNLKCEDAGAAVREVLLIQRMVRMLPERGMIHAQYLRMAGEILHDFLCVLRMALQAQRQGLHPLQQEECIERGNGRTCIAEENRADIGHKCCRPCRCHE